MFSAATTSVHRLARGDVAAQPLVTWGCPVPYFGDIRNAVVATLGINPSDREFVGVDGLELEGVARRFPTLGYLGLDHWREATSRELGAIVQACDGYFRGNPYDRWFRVLDTVLAAAGVSYYSKASPACHLDLVPYATRTKWGDLQPSDRRRLLAVGSDVLGTLLRESEVEVLVLNGTSVVRQFESVAGVELDVRRAEEWDLPRRGTAVVPGLAYTGVAHRIGEVALTRPIAVLGYNHNLQSSFGVTRGALDAIAEWIGSSVPRS